MAKKPSDDGNLLQKQNKVTGEILRAQLETVRPGEEATLLNEPG